MKQDDIITINIEALGSDACGISHYEEYTVFTPYVIPEETVLAKVTYVKRNIVYAKPLEVVIASPHRVKPLCPVFGKCGGCKLQHMDYETQLKFKTQQFVSCMNKIGNISVEPLCPVSGEQEYFYRNKLVLPVTQYKGKIQVGFYKDRSHDIVPIEDCPLHAEWNKILISCIKQYMLEAGERGYDHSSEKPRGDIRHLCARYIDGQLLVILVTNNPKGIKDADRLYSILRKKFPECGVFQSINTGNTNVVLGTEVSHLRGIRAINATAFGIKFTLRPESFFQVNPFVFTKLYADVKGHVKDTDVLIDAYSGTGVLTASLSSDKYDTFGVELNPSATRDADETAMLNGTKRQTNLNGDAKVVIPELFERFKDKRITLVVDPVRKGLDESISKLIAELAPEKFIYVSCNPATQARDLGIILSQQPSYRISYARVYDQFPQTVSSESIVVLECGE